jgi:hypothetical protein
MMRRYKEIQRALGLLKAEYPREYRLIVDYIDDIEKFLDTMPNAELWRDKLGLTR